MVTATRFQPISHQILMGFDNIKTIFKDMILKILYLTSKAKEAWSKMEINTPPPNLKLLLQTTILPSFRAVVTQTMRSY